MPGFELIGKEERKAVNELFDDGGVLFAHGFDSLRNGRYRVREFEKKFADYLGVKYAQAVSSGTAAIKISLIALGVKPGDEVITQAFTFVATAEAIIDVGAKPVFVNIDETLNMDPDDLERAITDKTSAIIPVHMLGVSAEQETIHLIARKYNIPILDDSCEALGAKWNNTKLGVQSDITAWSFDAGKTIIAGEGGMITTNDKELYLLAREYQDHGHVNNPSLHRGRDTHRIFGFNYRMTELQAAVVMTQLGKLDYIIERNKRNYLILESKISNIKGVHLRRIPNACTPSYDTLIIIFDKKVFADRCASIMADSGVATKNVPDAIEWHFVKYWDHMLSEIGLQYDELRKSIEVSTQLIERCVAFPIMVKTTEKQAIEHAEKIYKIIYKAINQ